ncbi:enamine deaminase RidA (YjgF/YER057c/UK114 family) [Flavobacterium sp. CAN_S2]
MPYQNDYLNRRKQQQETTKMKRENILTGSPWEDKMGYCRAVRIGNIIEVSGTVAIVDGEKVKADDAHAQTVNILERVKVVLEDLKVTMEDVIRTRIFTTDISTFEDVASAHALFFKDIKPTTGFYEISKLVAPEYLVEIEFTAIATEKPLIQEGL